MDRAKLIRLGYWAARSIREGLEAAEEGADGELGVHIRLAARRVGLVEAHLRDALAELREEVGERPGPDEIKRELGSLMASAVGGAERDARAGGPLDLYTIVAAAYSSLLRAMAEEAAGRGEGRLFLYLRAAAEELEFIIAKHEEILRYGV